MRAAKQGSSNLGSIFFIVFVFTVCLSRGKAVDLDIDFKQFFWFVQFTYLNSMELFLDRPASRYC